MPTDRIDISELFLWEEGLPRPQWDLIQAWVTNRIDPDAEDETAEVWRGIAQHWLEKLCESFGEDYRVAYSDHFLLLAPRPEPRHELLLDFAEQCRQSLLAVLSGVAAFRVPGPQVVIVLKNPEMYYQYLSVYDPEGHHGASAGAHIRDGYKHVALCGRDLALLENTLAHELTHASLAHLTLPPWIEEGLAQMFEHDMTRRSQLQVNAEMARAHNRFWAKRGLDMFWRGEGFSRPDKGQRLSYELAEILLRLLCEDYRPRWFGFNRGGQRRLLAFLREADAIDCGEAAATENLGIGLSDLAAKFLGPGDWSSSL
jgi:hypothetical protein